MRSALWGRGARWTSWPECVAASGSVSSPGRSTAVDVQPRPVERGVLANIPMTDVDKAGDREGIDDNRRTASMLMDVPLTCSRARSALLQSIEVELGPHGRDLKVESVAFHEEEGAARRRASRAGTPWRRLACLVLAPGKHTDALGREVSKSRCAVGSGDALRR